MIYDNIYIYIYVYTHEKYVLYIEHALQAIRVYIYIYIYHLLFFEDHSPQCPSCPNCPSRCTRQVIDQTGHTKSVDWWTLGVLLFELLAGATGGNPPEGGRFLAEELVA